MAALDATYDPTRAGVVLTATALPAGTATVTIERTGPSGTAAGVRGAVGAAAEPGVTFITRDYEAPLGLPLTYTLTAYNASGGSLATATDTIELPASALDNPWLVDLAFPLNSQQINVEALRELAYETPSGVHRIVSRRAPVLTSGLTWTPSGELVFVTGDELAHDRARSTLGTGVPVLLRTSPAQGVGNLYFGVTGFVVERASRIAMEDARRFRVQLVQVDRPDPSIYEPLPPNSYALVKAEYASYAALRAAVASYDALANEFPGGGTSPYAPWPAEDV